MPSLPSLARRRLPKSQVGTLISAFESETQGVIVRTSPSNDSTIFYVLIVMLALMLVFVSLFKIDIVITGTGITVAQDGVIFVDAINKGVVHSILVKNGDLVKKDQVLATLDPTFTAADVAKYQQTIDSTSEEVTRLEAEQKGAAYNPAGSTDYQRLQLSLYLQRQAQYRSNVGNYDAQIAVQKSTLDQYERDVATYTERLKARNSLEDMARKLEAQGWGSKLQTLTANDNRLETQRLLTFSASQIPNIKNQIEVLQQQRQAFITQWNSDIAQWLSNDRTTIEQARQNLAQATMYNQLVTLKAPEDAYVLKIGKASVGSIVGSGSPDLGPDPMFTLVPMIHPLLVEDDIATQDIGFVKVGDTVNVKLDAYQFIYYGTATGVVKSISQSSFTTDVNNNPVPPYFKVMVELTDTRLKDIPHPLLIPGMTLSGDIVTGKRTILDYMSEGILRAGSEALREP